MNSARFDHLSRLAATGSRRDVLHMLFGAILAMRLTPAKAVHAELEGVVVVGGACATTIECRQSEMQAGATCADNGFTSDGALNCCLRSGSGQACCESDADCCGDERCAPTGDVCYACAQPPFPTRLIGQVCAAESDCVPSVTCEVGCIQGRCNCVEDGVWTAPPGLPPPPDIPDAEAALLVARNLSRLETEGRFDALFDRMHPDAQRVIPREAVVGWYQAALSQQAFGVAEPTKVRFIPWTWDVTGETYPETAEVAYRQHLADGTLVRGEVRLVKDGYGNWSWFFGRDRAFVNEQIARFTGDG